MQFFKRIRILYILHRHAIKHKAWESACGQITLLQDISSVKKAHLRELSTLFLYDKNIYGAQGFIVTEQVRLIIAIQACLPVLELGIELLNGWRNITVYPEAFIVDRDQPDEFGIVHHDQHLLSGESWLRGPVIFSWQDIELDMQRWHTGHNVIIHEIAHKLDALNGKTNGMPPLHTGMHSDDWASAFSAGYQRLTQRLEHHQQVCVNPYAATSPAEFFAVFSEYFFCAPETLKDHFSDIYQLLCQYYLQDPLKHIH